MSEPSPHPLDSPFAEVRAIYEQDVRLRMPPDYAVHPDRFDLRR